MGGCVYGIKIASTAKSHKVLDLVAEAVMVRFLAACSYGNIFGVTKGLGAVGTMAS